MLKTLWFVMLIVGVFAVVYGLYEAGSAVADIIVGILLVAVVIAMTPGLPGKEDR